jgi:hypothetical protein
MKVSRRLAHRINNELQIAIAAIGLGQSELAVKTLLGLSQLIAMQTVKTVDNCEACGFRRATLEPKENET